MSTWKEQILEPSDIAYASRILIMDHNYTIRQCADALNVSKSTVHTHIHRDFKDADLEAKLYQNQVDGRRLGGHNSKRRAARRTGGL